MGEAGERGALTGPVLVVGTGLLGTSIGLALRRQGVEVLLRDVNPQNVTIASSVGAGVDMDALEAAPELQLVVHAPALVRAEAAIMRKEPLCAKQWLAAVPAPRQHARALRMRYEHGAPHASRRNTRCSRTRPLCR